ERDPGYWGAANVDLMRQYRHRLMVLVTFGMTPPLGRLELDAEGRRVLRLPLNGDLRTYYRDTKELLHSILRGNGCRIVRTEFLDSQGVPREDLHFSTAHQVGSCRMADSKKRGVTRVTGEVFDYPGMYVTDGSAIPGSLAVNTSLTILANAERITAGMLSRYTARRPAMAVASAGPSSP
ncbi:MAG TPA: GMC oxidoreductase, partial [Gemmatimonadales bacterium]|nr:GMC oxidoreductase [Gemmatimonadales bacterium]